MNGTSPFSSNQSATYSRRIEGANGRKLSRRLILRFRMSFVSAARVTDNGAVTERARPPFHSPLKPTDHSAGSYLLSRSVTELGFIGDTFAFTPAGLKIARLGRQQSGKLLIL